ncbi:MAG: 3-methyl-2-oxobutanoate hydroxymethyltransferase, partial [Halobacteria archaeon]|nr:3-methyl-2-oxobutanoate hydroxymethyltransferase [Halobacteria archaeon]
MTTVQELAEMKDEGEPITMLTAYDASTAEIVDEGGVDIILVGDSVGNTQLGYDTTLPVTLEESLSHTAAVSRGVEDAMVVGDMPFMSFGTSVEESVKNAGKYLKEAGANGVKFETPIGGETTVEVAERLTELGVPVMGHTGLTPQRIHATGGYRVEGRGEQADALVETAKRLEEAGVFSLVLEMVPEDVAKRVTEEIDVPTIGIGAGRYVDGQVLV